MSAGLRERKKARTRAAIQDAALRLFGEQGYQATTVNEIAESAEVSQATFFRYFPTKEDTVLYDRLDPLFIESLRNQPSELSPIAAARAAVHEVFTSLPDEAMAMERQRWQLLARESRLRAALANQVEGPFAMMAEAVAERVGRRSDDTDVVMWLGAVAGALFAAAATAMNEPDPDILGIMDTGFAYLEAGMPL